MNENKRTKIKSAIRQYAPEIIVGTTVVVGLGAFYWLVKDAQKTDIGVAATKDMLRYITNTGSGVLFQVEEGNFILKQVDW